MKKISILLIGILLASCSRSASSQAAVIAAPTVIPPPTAAPAQQTINSAADLAYIQQAMSARTVPAIDEQLCSQQVAGGMQNKFENGICYIRGPQDPPDVWVAIGVEYPEFSCQRSQYSISGSYDAASKICTVRYNQTTTRWSWTGSGWQQAGQ